MGVHRRAQVRRIIQGCAGVCQGHKVYVMLLKGLVIFEGVAAWCGRTDTLVRATKRSLKGCQKVANKLPEGEESGL